MTRLKKIYHITHIDNLDGIIKDGGLWSDAQRDKRKIQNKSIGIHNIKNRRLNIEIPCQSNTYVGQYVPFYFCHRSIMLFMIHKPTNPDLPYRDGQKEIIHLRLDIQKTIQWADSKCIKWAFSDRNAASKVAQFFVKMEDLSKLNLKAINATTFTEPKIKDEKQAEFLLFDFMPFNLVEKIGVHNQEILDKVSSKLSNCSHKPIISIEKTWYY